MEENATKILTEAKKTIPSVDELIQETAKALNLTDSYIKTNFGKALVSFDEKATQIFRSYESNAMLELARSWVTVNKPRLGQEMKEILIFLDKEDWHTFVEKASRLFQEFAKLVQSFEKDLGNMRKARGGKVFEKAVLMMLQRLGFRAEAPSKKHAEKLGRVDIIVPSAEEALNYPDRAVFLTCKRTLRERWKQEIPQIERNCTAYLI